MAKVTRWRKAVAPASIAAFTFFNLAFASNRTITIASTTSTEQSGFFDAIIPKFREATGIDVKVVAVGTGQALAIGREGDADALLVHDREGEEKFVADGFGMDRRDVMYNDFVIVGPASDPAHVKASANVLDAMRAVAAAKASFTSRGDDSGTHRMEVRLWKKAGIAPATALEKNYRELGQGMGPTLNTAAALDAYTITDRATWAAFKNRQNLTTLFEGDAALFNPYSSILVSPSRFPGTNASDAKVWHEWLTSPAGRETIRSFRVRSQQVFFIEPEASGIKLIWMAQWRKAQRQPR